MVNCHCNIQWAIHLDKLGHQSVSRSIRKQINIAENKAVLLSNNSLILLVRLKMVVEGGGGVIMQCPFFLKQILSF